MEETGSSPLGRGTAYYGLAIVTLLNFLNYIDRSILAAVLPRVQEELRLTDFRAGLLAFAFLIAYFITSPFFGALGDRMSRTRLMAAGVGAWSLATAASGLARSFAQMMMARASVGVGEAGYATISPALLSDYFPPRQRGRVFAVFYVALPVGIAVGYLIGGFIEPVLGWRAAFYVVGLPGIALALLALTAADPPRGISENVVTVNAPEPFWTTLGALLRNRPYAGTVAGYTAYTFALGGLSYWMPKYLVLARGVALSQANYIVGGVTVLAGLAGTFAGGYIGDFLALRMKNGQIWICGASSVAAIIPTWLALTVDSSPAYLVWLFVAEFFLFLSTGPVNVVIVNVVPIGVRAMAMAVSIFAIHLLGDAISPAIIGLLADIGGMTRAVMIVPVTIGLSGVFWTATAITSRQS